MCPVRCGWEAALVALVGALLSAWGRRGPQGSRSLTGVPILCSSGLYVSRPELTPFTLNGSHFPLPFAEK